MAEPIALQFHPPQIAVPQFQMPDTVGALMKAAQIQHANTSNLLAQAQLKEQTALAGAREAYRANPNDMGALNGFPELQSGAIKTQQLQEQYRNEQIARSAQELLHTTREGTPERAQGYVRTVADLTTKGIVPPLAAHSVLSQAPTDEVLKTHINRGLPLQASEVPKYQEVDSGKYGEKRFAFVDNVRQTINGQPIGAAGNQPQAGNYGTRLEGLTGKEFMDALDPGDRAQVQAIIEGRKPIPSPNARTPFTQRLAEWVAQADPGFDNTVWRARNQLRAEFASTKNGTAGGNIQALETAINHGEKLRAAHEALNNSGVPLGTIAREWIGNPIARNLSEGMSNFDAREGSFNAVRKGYFDEVAKVFAGTSGGVFDRAEWEHKLNAASSPAKREEVMATLTDMMKGRLTALANSANRNNLQHGKEFGPYDLVNPTTAAKMKRILKEDSDLAPAGSKTDNGPLPQTNAAPKEGVINLLKQIQGGAKTVTLPSGKTLSDVEFLQAYKDKYGPK